MKWRHSAAAPLSQQAVADALGHPDAQRLAAHWQRNRTHAEPTELNQALRLFPASQLGDRNARSRLADVEAAHQQLAELVEQMALRPGCSASPAPLWPSAIAAWRSSPLPS